MIPLEKIPVPPAADDAASQQEPGAGVRGRVHAMAREARRVVHALRDLGGQDGGMATNGGTVEPPPYDDAPYSDGVRRYYTPEVHDLMKAAVRAGVDPAEVFYHRGLWGRFELFDAWQFDALRRAGLEPRHHVLDIGCGPLRLGMRLVPFLDDDRYCGIDPVASYIEAGRTYLRDFVATDREARLLCDGDFDFARFDRQFDFAIAHSVFTHLSWEQIARCFARLVDVMKPGGKLLFTVTFGQPAEWRIVYVGGHPMTKSRTRDLGFYEELGERLGFGVDRLDEAQQDHPTQHVCVATF